MSEILFQAGRVLPSILMALRRCVAMKYLPDVESTTFLLCRSDQHSDGEQPERMNKYGVDC